jgi:CRISPR-associated endonuclease/helicase Cas3
MSYRDFFRELTGFTPSPFQERVADAILHERNVILRAPTGSGKTWAVAAPFLYSLATERPIADRLLYVLPLRSLATSLFESTAEVAKSFSPLRQSACRIQIQTGERRDDPLFEGLVTFTTIDQLLSSYLIHPVGLPARCGNLNAGALIGSLICFDEFHLLEPQKSMATAIEMLDTLARGEQALSRFVLMTATLSTESLEWLAKKLDAELIEVSPEEVKQLPSQQEKTRYYRWIDQPLTAEAVVHAHAKGRSIVIANTVSRAQELYEQLRSPSCQQALGDETKIRLLHSRFLPRDRQRIEADLASWFGPEPTVSDVILVSTQVIEAGLDFSCDNLHTEVAPMNAIVQRAGRCARRRGQTGTVWCYALALDARGKPAYGPYRELRNLVDDTASALSKEAAADRAAYEFHDELRLVNAVHTTWELDQLRPLDNLHAHRQAVRGAMDGDNPAAVRELVRDVFSINVVITDSPEALNFNRRQWPEMLSVPPTSLYRLFKEPRPNLEWIAKSAREGEEVQGGAIEVDWEPLRSGDDIKSAGWLVAIHPDCATYDEEIGLVVGRRGPAKPIQYRERPKFTRYSYSREEYAEHIRRVCAAGARRDADYCVASRRLSKFLGVAEPQLAAWLKLVYQLHDIGKLSVAWQDAIWTSQAAKTGLPPRPRPALAHSDYDPSTDSGRKETRPPHAAEGAYAAIPLLSEAAKGDSAFLTAALTAITRHHGAFTSQLSHFTLIPDASAYVAQTLRGNAHEIRLEHSPPPNYSERFAQCLFQASNLEQQQTLPLYAYLIRRLRIADQNSFQEM